jgi:hypothetical protein
MDKLWVIKASVSDHAISQSKKVLNKIRRGEVYSYVPTILGKEISH